MIIPIKYKIFYCSSLLFIIIITAGGNINKDKYSCLSNNNTLASAKLDTTYFPSSSSLPPTK